jgi:hypothetical protein
MATQQYSLPNISVQFAFQDLSTSTTPQPFSPRSINVSNGYAYTPLQTGSLGTYLATNTLGNFSPNSGSLRWNHSAATTASGTTALTTSSGTALPITSNTGFNLGGGSVTITHAGSQYTVSYTGIYFQNLSGSTFNLSTTVSTTVTCYSAPTGWPSSGSFTIMHNNSQVYTVSYTGISGSNLTGCLITSGPTTSFTTTIYDPISCNQLNGAQVTSGGNFSTSAGDAITQSGVYTLAYSSTSGSVGNYSFSGTSALSPTATFLPFNSTTDTITTWNWYEANIYARNFQTKMGRQHELDRSEAATLSLQLDNRDGRWYPWNTNTFSYTSVTTGATTTFAPSAILTVGVPVRILATWRGVQYPAYFGYVDAWQPSAPDELNTDTTVTATDILKLLSLTRLANANLYQSQLLAANPSGVADLVRCNDTPTLGTGFLPLQNSGAGARILSGSSAGVTLSRASSATLVFSATYGIAGFPRLFNTAGGTFQLSHKNRLYTVSYASMSDTSLSYYTFTGCSLVQNTSITTQVGDFIYGGIAAPYVTTGSSTSLTASAFGKQGVQVYDPNAGGIDLTNGTSSGVAWVGMVVTNYPSSTSAIAGAGYTIEGWFQNPSVNDVLLCFVDNGASSNASTTYAYNAFVSSNGQIQISRTVITTSPATTTVFANTAGPSVNDGNWHLVTMSVVTAASSGINLHLFVDGIYCGYASVTTSATSGALVPGGMFWGGSIPSGAAYNYVLQQAATTATVSDLAFVMDEGLSATVPPGFGGQSLNRYRTGAHFKTAQTTCLVTTATTINNATTTTVPVGNSTGFNPAGGMATAVVSGINYEINYTGTTATSLLGVTLYPNATASTATLALPVGNAIYQTQTISTGYRLMEVAEVAGLVPDDNSTTLTTAPLNYSFGVVEQLSAEPSTTFATTALDYGFQFEDTENGFYYQDQSGNLVFLSRFYPQTHPQNSAQWSDSGTATNQPHYQPNVEVFMDDLDTWEVAQMTTPGGATTYVSDPTGTYVNQYAPRTYSRGQVWASRTQDVNALGYLIVNRYRQPITRPQKVVLDCTYVDGSGNQPNQLAILGTNLWDQVVFNRSAYGSNYAQAVVVESIAHDYKAEPGQWQTTFVLSPYEMNGSSTVNAGSFFQISTSSVAADYSKFQSAQTSVAFASTISSTASSVQVTPQTAPSGLPYGIALPASASSGTTISHAGTNYAVAYTGKAQTNTTTSSVVSLTTSSSVTLTLASVTNFPTTGGIFYITNGAITYNCTYASVSGSTITGCKLGAQYSGITVTTASGNAVYGPQLLTGVTCASSVSLTAGDTAYYTSGTAQDTFGG